MWVVSDETELRLYGGEILGFGLDRDVPPKPQNPYIFLRVIYAKKVPISEEACFSKFSGEHPKILGILDDKHPKF